jgi:hypothetical protein
VAVEAILVGLVGVMAPHALLLLTVLLGKSVSMVDVKMIRMVVVLHVLLLLIVQKVRSV